MKKPALFIVLILTFCITLSACSFNMGKDTVTLQYHENEIRENLQKLADESGVHIVLSVTGEKTDDDGELTLDPDNKYDLVYNARNNIYYYRDQSKEYIFDLSLPIGYTSYERSLTDELWTKKYTLYGASITEQTAREELNEVTKEFFECLTSHLGFDGETMNQSTATVAGRDCAKYYISMKLFGVSISYTTYVDNGTGACLGMDCDVTAFKEKSDVAVFDCTEFTTGFSVEIPSIELIVTGQID